MFFRRRKKRWQGDDEALLMELADESLKGLYNDLRTIPIS